MNTPCCIGGGDAAEEARDEGSTSRYPMRKCVNVGSMSPRMVCYAVNAHRNHEGVRPWDID